MSVKEPNGWVFSRKRLLKDMKEALLSTPAGFVNLSQPKHAVTTPCLWEVTYDQNLSYRVLDVRWSDGSRSEFPCGQLPEIEHSTTSSKLRLRLGLMSFRHPELDYLVDLYACRNRELAVLKSMADEEAYSFERARSILLDPTFDNGGLIEVYHTGLEPMVVGFYRGVVASLLERKRRNLSEVLAVRPMFYAGKPQKKGFTADSSGAKAENYIQSEVWV